MSASAEPALLQALSHPQAFPSDADAHAGIRRVDTHISHVFLTGRRVYKLRRPVALPFLDFSSRDERDQDCLREVALNRRLAADVYLGVAPVLARGGSFVIGEVAETLSGDDGAVEHCVVMRRLPEGRDMKSLLAQGAIRPAHVDAVAARMAAFHAQVSLGHPAPFEPGQWLERTTAPARANIEALLHGRSSLVPVDRVRAVAESALRFAEAHEADFGLRLSRGRIVDGHGDLHTEHVWFESGDADSDTPVMPNMTIVVDCLEFRQDFRHIDAASDIAFLAMDLQYRGRADLASRLLRRYARDSGDYHLYGVVDYFLSYRALVRAKVASLVAADDSLPQAQRDGAADSTRRHLELGAEFLQSRPPGAVVLIAGLIGTGKTTAAEAIADAMGGVVLSSDRVRKDRAGLAATDSARATAGGGIYGDSARAGVYAAMLEEAAPIVASGRSVLLDATFGRRGWRESARAWAGSRGSEAWLVEIVAAKEAVLRRLDERQRRGGDASDAGPELYETLAAQWEEADEWPAQRRVLLNTDSPDWLRSAQGAAERIICS